MPTRLLKLVVFVVCLIPGAILLYRAFWTGDLGVNPVETLQDGTGKPALQILIATLAVTPIRRLTGWNQVIKVRRMLGLFAFTYVLVHLSFYVVFDRFFDFAGIIDDVVVRKFILSGMLGFACLLPLAITSTKGWIRRLGRRWQQLHRLIYVAALAGAVHFVWKEKVLTRETLSYFAIVAVLLAYRAVTAARKRLVAAPAQG